MSLKTVEGRLDNGEYITSRQKIIWEVGLLPDSLCLATYDFFIQYPPPPFSSLNLKVFNSIIAWSFKGLAK